MNFDHPTSYVRHPLQGDLFLRPEPRKMKLRESWGPETGCKLRFSIEMKSDDSVKHSYDDLKYTGPKKNKSQVQVMEKEEKQEKPEEKVEKPEEEVETTEEKPTMTTAKEDSSPAIKGWEFGKRKTFTPPEDNEENNKAAIQIQRIARGGWQRLKYRIAYLEHMLNTRQERTDAAVAKIHDRMKKRKAKFYKKMKLQAKKGDKKIEIASETAQDAQRIIAFLRKENKKLREKNQKIYTAICNLKEQNARLEDANVSSDESFSMLNDRAKEIEETHKKLMEIVPKYEESVADLKKAVEIRRRYCLTEHKIKVMYVNLVGKIVQRVEGSKQTELADEVVDLCVDMEENEHGGALPPKLDDHLAGDSEESISSDDDSVDAYTVATFD